MANEMLLNKPTDSITEEIHETEWNYVEEKESNGKDDKQEIPIEWDLSVLPDQMVEGTYQITAKTEGQVMNGKRKFHCQRSH